MGAGFYAGCCPKLLTLAAYRGRFPDALNADLCRFYGGTLRQLREQVTCRELAAMVAGLPLDGSSAVYRAIRPHDWWWDQVAELLASIHDQLAVSVAGKDAIFFPRPTDITPASTGFDTPEQFTAWRNTHMKGDAHG